MDQLKFSTASATGSLDIPNHKIMRKLALYYDTDSHLWHLSERITKE